MSGIGNTLNGQKSSSNRAWNKIFKHLVQNDTKSSLKIKERWVCNIWLHTSSSVTYLDSNNIGRKS